MDILGLLGWAASAISGQVAAIVTWVTGGFGVLFGDIALTDSFLEGAISAIWGVFSGLWGWLNQIYQWINSHIIQQLRDLIKNIHDRLAKIFGPLLAQIRKMIALYRQLWLQYMKPIFDLMQRIRKFLVLFRLLGFKWAIKLDAKITQMETALELAFFGVLQNLNTLANWINYIIDPFGIFQPFPLLGGVAQAIGAIIGLGVKTMQGPGATARPGQYTTAAGYYDATATHTRTETRLTAGVLPEDDAVVTSLRASAAAMGYTV